MLLGLRRLPGIPHLLTYLATELVDDFGRLPFRWFLLNMPICPLCPGRDFVDELAIQQHQQAKHFRCGSCNWIFSSKDRLEQHMATKHAKYACDSCATELLSQQALDQHKRDKHPKTFECTHCDREFTTVDAREQHEHAKHSYQCSKCDDTFHSAEARERHQQTEHPPTFECTYCNQEFTREGARDKHKLAKHANWCHLCRRDFGSSEALQQHRNAKHRPALSKHSPQSSSPTSSGNGYIEAARVSVESKTSNFSSKEVLRPDDDVPTKTSEDLDASKCQCTICERAGQPCSCSICKRGDEVVMVSSPAPPLTVT
ncbi:hypothetical protein F5I97DRAFT_355496 [Phlebopus sp. FC_14]|nr:hypothetical protein F5I97DRAFT_355496 [Phlebopus sp. FC_14]